MARMADVNNALSTKLSTLLDLTPLCVSTPASERSWFAVQGGSPVKGKAEAQGAEGKSKS